jgi:hypothetical protein
MIPDNFSCDKAAAFAMNSEQDLGEARPGARWWTDLWTADALFM